MIEIKVSEHFRRQFDGPALKIEVPLASQQDALSEEFMAETSELAPDTVRDPFIPCYPDDCVCGECPA